MTQAQLDELVKEERREYFRKWRAANKDKVRQHNQNYWVKRAQNRLQQEGKEGE